MAGETVWRRWTQYFEELSEIRGLGQRRGPGRSTSRRALDRLRVPKPTDEWPKKPIPYWKRCSTRMAITNSLFVDQAGSYATTQEPWRDGGWAWPRIHELQQSSRSKLTRIQAAVLVLRLANFVSSPVLPLTQLRSEQIRWTCFRQPATPSGKKWTNLLKWRVLLSRTKIR